MFIISNLHSQQFLCILVLPETLLSFYIIMNYLNKEKDKDVILCCKDKIDGVQQNNYWIQCTL